jgi:preprotein translocase subunit SecD
MANKETTCSKCGAEFQDGFLFCMGCGQPLKKAVSPRPPKGRAGGNRIVWFLAGAAAAVLIGTVVLLLRPEPVKAKVGSKLHLKEVASTLMIERWHAFGATAERIPAGYEAVKNNTDQAREPLDKHDRILVRKTAVVTEHDIDHVEPAMTLVGDRVGKWCVAISLAPEAGRRLSYVTERLSRRSEENRGRPGSIAMFLEGKMLMRAPVNTVISEQLQITGGYTEAEAKDLAKRLVSER